MKVKAILSKTAKLPACASDGAACFDFHADIIGKRQVAPGRQEAIPTGVKMEVPDDHVLLVFSRSGHGFNKAVRLANCVGVIDSDYRGEIQVALRADGQHILDVNPGDRIAQGLILPISRVEFELAEELSSTDRGTNGFGSTGTGSLT